MNNTKEEITIKITQKDKVYLSVILCLVCVIACICILVPRYYQQNPSIPTVPPTNQNNQSSGTNPNNGQVSDSNNQYANLYSTLVINTLTPLGMPYSTMAKHLDSQNNLNVSGLNITEPKLWVLEELAFPIYSSLSSYTSNQIAITIDLINSNNTLYSQIVAFSNSLNELHN